MFLPDVSRPVGRDYTYTDYKGEVVTRRVFGFCIEGVCSTCDSFFPHGPEHSTRHGHHCSCDGCF